MGHSYTKLWVHLVFSTKNREHLISQSLEAKLYDYIRDHLIELGCLARIINGISDHVHILFLQTPNKSIAEIVKNVKGNSSHWVNQNDLCMQKFSWQTGYAAFAVSESQVSRVYEYIKNQKQHHLQQDFLMEYDQLIEWHGLKKDDAPQ